MPKIASPSRPNKTESVTLRFEQRLRFGLELLSRRQRRKMTSVIEWMVEKQLVDPDNGLMVTDPKTGKPCSLLTLVWDPMEADRLVKLALFDPGLLSFEEQMLWKVISEDPRLWKQKKRNDKWHWTLSFDQLNITLLREYWPIYQGIAKGEKTEADLPPLKLK